MTSRELPPDEWSRLNGTDLGEVAPMLSPAWATVIVVENEAQKIVGTMMLMTVVNLEGTWVAPEYRKTGAVARRLLKHMKMVARRAGVSSVLTRSMSEEVTEYLKRIGARAVPGEEFVVPVEE